MYSVDYYDNQGDVCTLTCNTRAEALKHYKFACLLGSQHTFIGWRFTNDETYEYFSFTELIPN